MEFNIEENGVKVKIFSIYNIFYILYFFKKDTNKVEGNLYYKMGLYKKGFLKVIN